MLNVMRDNLRHLRWVLWLVAASMVLYLGAFFSCEDPKVTSGEWSVKIDGEPLPATQLRNAARAIDNNYRQMFGESYEQLRPSLQLGSVAVNEMINSELVRRDAKSIGLTVADGELADAIRTDPSLSPDGVFIGTERYTEILNRQYPGGVAAYESAVAKDIVRNKWSQLMTQSVQVGDDELRSLFQRRTEKTAIDYVIFATADQEAELNSSDEDLRSWYDAHQDDYKRDPGRKIRYIMLDRDAYTDVVVSADELRASYEANISSYTHGDQRRARHILLKVAPDSTAAQRSALKAQAESLLSRVKAGEAFGPLAGSLSEDTVSAQNGGDLDFFDRGSMVPAFDEAAWSTPVGEFASVVETNFGFHVIQVTDERAAGTTPFEAVRPQIELRLKAQAQQNRLVAEGARIRAKLTDADSLDTVAAAEGLQVQERVVTRQESLNEIGVGPQFLPTIFSLEEGQVSEPLARRSGSIIAVVTQTLDAEIAPFDEVRTEVQGDLANETLRELARTAAASAGAADRGPQAVAKSAQLELLESGDLAPGQAPPGTGGSVAEMSSQLFGDAIAVGDRGVIPVPAGAIYYEIVRREPFDEDAFSAQKTELLGELESQRRSALENSLLERLRSKYKVEINSTLVAQLDGAR
jgi:peptidyl-prolyl cis-trans isomerase D